MNTDPLVEEYVRGLNDVELENLNTLFQIGDRGAAAELLSKTMKMDQWLAAATSPDDLFDRLDMVSLRISKKIRDTRLCD
jgi:hypothetical protein